MLLKHGHDPLAFAAGEISKKAARDAANGLAWSALKAADKDMILRELAFAAGLVG